MCNRKKPFTKKKIKSVNPLFLINNKTKGYIQEGNRNKYLKH